MILKNFVANNKFYSSANSKKRRDSYDVADWLMYMNIKNSIIWRRSVYKK